MKRNFFPECSPQSQGTTLSRIIRLPVVSPMLLRSSRRQRSIYAEMTSLSNSYLWLRKFQLGSQFRHQLRIGNKQSKPRIVTWTDYMMENHSPAIATIAFSKGGNCSPQVASDSPNAWLFSARQQAFVDSVAGLIPLGLSSAPEGRLMHPPGNPSPLYQCSCLQAKNRL